MDSLHQRGFTFVEALITLAITAVLASLSLAGFSNLFTNTQLATQSAHFLSAYTLARSEAVKRNQRVIICPRQATQCSNDTLWEKGWLVYTDTNGNGIAETSEIIRQFEPLAEGFTLRPSRNTTALVFSGNGQARKLSGSLPMMTLKLCASDAGEGNIKQRSREMVINGSGRLRLQRGREGKTVCS
jgi:type IV fimbrial biogenesis protein FimT